MENTTYMLNDGTTLKSWDTWGLKKTKRTEISVPVRDQKRMRIPGANGSKELLRMMTTVPTYADRTLTDTYILWKNQRTWENKKSRIYNLLNEADVKIILDRDPWFYWQGTASVKAVSDDVNMLTLQVSAQVYPYKYERFSSVEPWLWDPFNFEFGVIRDYRGIAISNSGTLTIPCLDLPVMPGFWTSDSGMKVSFGGTEYSLTARSSAQNPKTYEQFAALILPPGEQTLTFTGTGSVDVLYRGGML